jgi:hypothetical protein
MNKNCNVFLGWSGNRSRHVAEFLRGWIPKVIQSARPWMSETDIDKGSRGLDEITKALSEIKVGISCLTPENLQRPWISFEAGALSRTIGDQTRLCTYLIASLAPQDVLPPLGMFQATRAEKNDTLKLMRTINVAVSAEPVSEEDLQDIFDAMWPKLDKHLATLPPAEEFVPAKRSTDDMIAEILQIVRTEANARNKPDVLSGLSAPGISETIEPVLLRGLATKTLTGKKTARKRSSV